MITGKCGVKCYLVGAGPGAVNLLTLRALQVLQQADVVIYDRLTSPEMLDYAPVQAERIYIGQYNWKGWKNLKKHPTAIPRQSKQKSLDLLLRVCQYFNKLHENTSQSRKPSKILKTLNPYKVVRLKGGDPFVFGRAQEEMNALLSKGIPFEVIPGISSFQAAAALAGIPLTLLEKGRSFSVLTGHFSKQDEQAKRKVIATSDTVIYLMGVKNLARLVRENLKAGKPPSTPIAIIENVSLPKQRIRVCQLSDVLIEHKQDPICHPAVLIIGETAQLHKRFDWAAQYPLAGVRIGFLRAAHELKELKSEIENLGGVPIEMPLIEHKILHHAEKKLLKALSRQNFRTLLLTSKRTVERLFQILKSFDKDLRILNGLTIVAIGKGTAESLAGYGIRADVIAETSSQEGIRDVIVKRKLNDILIPQSKQARPWLVNWIKAEGYRYETFSLYNTVLNVSKQRPQKKMIEILKSCNIIMVTSESALRALRIFIELHFLELYQTGVNATQQYYPIQNSRFPPIPIVVTLSKSLEQRSREELGGFFKRAWENGEKNAGIRALNWDDYFISSKTASYRSMVETAVRFVMQRINKR